MSTTSTGSSSPRSDAAAPSLPTVPTTPTEVRRTLTDLEIRPSKRWGQSFLVDPFVADAEAALVDGAPGRPVLEIGGGLGILTAALVRRGLGPLTVLERDPRLAEFLRATFGRRVRVIAADALEVELPSADCVVGNLPYSIATPILRRLFEARVPRIVFLVQREVAERIAAGPGSKQYGRLSIWARYYGSVELFRTVAPDAFTPRPEVESRLAVHVARPDPLPVRPATLDRILTAVFSDRRKQLGNLLPRLFPSREEADRRALAAGWPRDWPRRRPEELAPELYFELGRRLERPDERGADTPGHALPGRLRPLRS